MGVVISPLATSSTGETIPVVDFGSGGVVRCKRCRTYINPFVTWVDNGRRWRCNLCGSANDVSSAYFCHLNADGTRTDVHERPELRNGSVEIIAPAEYMMRPPQPPVFMFVIDVSANAVASGMLQSCVETILDKLDDLPGGDRTKVGFITFDKTVHFYNLKAGLKAPQVMVVPDIAELFIPIPDDLLVNLSDSLEVVTMLLELMPSMYGNTTHTETALGPALRAAFRVMQAVGGKMLLFQSSLPSTGQGVLKNRENPRVLGTDKETSLFSPIDTFYRQNAIEFSRMQVSVDTFFFSSTYTDVATLGSVSKYSAGQVFYYPKFNTVKDGEKFSCELSHCLTRETGWEAVMRVRATQGMRLSNFYGNSFMRGADLLALPNVDTNSTFAVDMIHADAVLNTSVICVQAALLYTTSCGERRIRVHTMAAPVTKLYAEIFRSVNVDALCNVMAKSALEVALKTGLELARQQLQNHLVSIIRAYRSAGAFNTQGGNGVNLPDACALLPLYVMALLKSPTFRGGSEIGSDERTYLMYELNNMAVSESQIFIYPRLFTLDDMAPEMGLAQDGSGPIVLPPVISLSIERLRSDGIFLLEDGRTFYIWLGRGTSPALLHSLFGIPALDGVNVQALALLDPPVDEYGTRVQSILESIREERRPFMETKIMVEGDPTEAKFFWKLIEDRASFNGGSYSYAEYLGLVYRLSQQGPAKTSH